MAKIGNEANLILKLVTEEMQKHAKENIYKPDLPWDYQRGYSQALANLGITIRDIMVELESKH